MGELPDGEMHVSRSIWNGRVTDAQDAQGPRACSSDSAISRAVGDASAALREPTVRADLRQQLWESRSA